jgi:hypothetical protein
MGLSKVSWKREEFREVEKGRMSRDKRKERCKEVGVRESR